MDVLNVVLVFVLCWGSAFAGYMYGFHRGMRDTLLDIQEQNPGIWFKLNLTKNNTKGQGDD